jgi:hypothetical protein
MQETRSGLRTWWLFVLLLVAHGVLLVTVHCLAWASWPGQAYRIPAVGGLLKGFPLGQQALFGIWIALVARTWLARGCVVVLSVFYVVGSYELGRLILTIVDRPPSWGAWGFRAILGHCWTVVLVAVAVHIVFAGRGRFSLTKLFWLTFVVAAMAALQRLMPHETLRDSAGRVFALRFLTVANTLTAAYAALAAGHKVLLRIAAMIAGVVISCVAAKLIMGWSVTLIVTTYLTQAVIIFTTLRMYQWMHQPIHVCASESATD